MANDKIVIKGARVHNLQSIDVEIPRDKLVVITGLSGSGKSSLAFDTLYAEGQRRYVESLSSYARQFLGQMDKPDVDSIEGLSPAISIDQKTTSRNPRSTVGTVTEIHDYLRLLFARIGKPHCPKCGRPISSLSIDQILDEILSWPEGSRLQLLAPMVRGRKGEFSKVFSDLRAQGYVRVRVDGELRELSEEFQLEKQKKHSIEVVVDRIVLRPGAESRLADSAETALGLADGLLNVLCRRPDGTESETLFSQHLSCPDCGISIGEISPRMFSFNNPFGACPSCSGLGVTQRVSPELMIPEPERSINEGAICGWTEKNSGWYYRHLEALSRKYHFSLDAPFAKLSQTARDIILYGSPGTDTIRVSYNSQEFGMRTVNTKWEGLVPNFERRHKETYSSYVRDDIERYMVTDPCPDCGGARLRPESLAVRINGVNIHEMSCMVIWELRAFLDRLSLSEREHMIGDRILKEIRDRLDFLINVGLDYLSLSRAAGTLSGGEAQRIRLATQIGSHLMGVMYILDEPSIGLHQKDNAQLIATLQQLRDLGNTVIVVEHDEETMRAADYLIDIGPGAGAAGGRVVACGTPEEVMRVPESVTGRYLLGTDYVPLPAERRKPEQGWIHVAGARVHNLKNLDVDFPIGLFTCVTGVSGSGKSSLVNEILYRSLAKTLNRSRVLPGEHDAVTGIEGLEKVIDIDQSAIGRTPRSNPATYTGLFDLIRELFSQTPEAKMRGYKPGRFSFNVRGGRCESCQGDGIVKIEMHFLSDVYVPCEVCRGKRYNRETLEVHYKGKNIADVLDMTVDEAAEFFAKLPRIYRKLQTLQDVGLGYIKLGQPATTLSGGEAQRIKLATELSRRSDGRTVYILDEPTTGLHTDDIRKLLDALERLVDAGNSVIVIEHNLSVIKMADYIIDLGPDGGSRGGQIVACGTPEELAVCKKSYTGRFLAEELKKDRERH